MAKLIILEGLSRTGKTTIVNDLKKTGYGRVISIEDKMPDKTELSSFYKGTFVSYDAFLKAFPEETFILDRAFLSEMVYSKFFGRVQAISNSFIHDFICNHDIHLFYLWNEYKDYMVRKPKDRVVYDAKDYARLMNLFENNLKVILPTCGFVSINTSQYNIKETTKIIKKNLWQTKNFQLPSSPEVQD